MRILLLKTLFALDESHIIANMNSLRSILNVQKKCFDIRFNIKMHGWVSPNIKQLFIKQIANVIKDFSEITNTIKIDYEILENNFGKLYAIKSMIKEINISMYDVFIYADHDICFNDSTTDFFKQCVFNNCTLLASLFTNMINGRLIKLISFKQKDDERHNPIIYTNKIIINNISYHYALNNINVASGCFITDSDGIIMITRLTSKNEYGDEDVLIGECLNKLFFCNVVLAKHYVIHPYDTNKEYSNWKKQKIFINQAVKLLDTRVN